MFLANIWLSTYATDSGPQLAAFIWDASENLRDREGTGLNSMMATSRVVIGAVSHEIRNLAAAALSAHRGLASLAGIEQVEHFRALGTIITGLERIAASGLRLSSGQRAAVTNLGMLLDEFRVVIEPAFRDAGISIDWQLAHGLPLVQGDHHSLLQVFLNLGRNSERALDGAERKELTVVSGLENDLVMVRFQDTGTGVSSPDDLFKPFQPAPRRPVWGFTSRAPWSGLTVAISVTSLSLAAVASRCNFGPPRTARSITGADMRRLRTLIVDDHALFRESVAGGLGAESDLEISHCASIREALNLLQRESFDLVLLDHDLGSERAFHFLPSSPGDRF